MSDIKHQNLFVCPVFAVAKAYLWVTPSIIMYTTTVTTVTTPDSQMWLQSVAVKFNNDYTIKGSAENIYSGKEFKTAIERKDFLALPDNLEDLL